jgi:phage host-nuclease inhibitor protein Gam
MDELLNELSELTKQTKVYYESYQQAKMREDLKRDELKQYMLSTGILSAKTKDLTASIVSKPTIEIKHEQSVLEWLENEPNLEIDQFIGLKLTPFKKYALHKLKETGEQINGIDVIMQDSLAIRSV